MPRVIGWEIVVYLLSLVGAAVTYGWVVYDGIVTRHWMHPFTLHPIFAYAIAAFLAWRHRRRRGVLQITAAAVLVMGLVGVTLFLLYYTPEAHNRTKALIIMFVPLTQMFLMGGLAVLFELWRRPKAQGESDPAADERSATLVR